MVNKPTCILILPLPSLLNDLGIFWLQSWELGECCGPIDSPAVQKPDIYRPNSEREFMFCQIANRWLISGGQPSDPDRVQDRRDERLVGPKELGRCLHSASASSMSGYRRRATLMVFCYHTVSLNCNWLTRPRGSKEQNQQDSFKWGSKHWIGYAYEWGASEGSHRHINVRAYRCRPMHMFIDECLHGCL